MQRTLQRKHQHSQHDAAPSSARFERRAVSDRQHDAAPGAVEPRFGHDFSQIRVYDDASESAPEASLASAELAGPVTVQREDEDKPFWDSPIFKGLTGAGGLLPAPIGPLVKILRHPFQVASGAEKASEGDALGSFASLAGALSSVVGGAAALAPGGFSMLGAGGLGGAISAISSGGLGTLGTVGGLGATAGATMPASAVLTGGGLSGVAALGPAAAVLGAGAAGVGLGIGLDKGVDWIGDKITGNEGADHSISGGLADAMTWADQGISSLWADPSKPAYTQTLGWKLATMFD